MSEFEKALQDVRVFIHRPWLGVVKLVLSKDHQSVTLELSESQIRQAAQACVEALCERLKEK